MTDIYDTVAGLCAHMADLWSASFFTGFSCITRPERERVRATIRGRFPSIYGDDGSVKALDREEFTHSFAKSLESFVEEQKECGDMYLLMGTLVAIDAALKKVLKEEAESFTREGLGKCGFSLNSNRRTTGIGLLPRFQCCWERKGRLSHRYNRLDNFLSNLLVIEVSGLWDIMDRHIFLKEDVFPDFARTRSLKVAATPLRLTPPFKIVTDTRGKVNTFHVDYDLSREAEDNELVWSKIVKAGKSGADIILFPEMMGHASVEEFVRGRIKALAPKEARKLPGLIVLPSTMIDGFNTAVVLGRDGERICTQAKHIPFKMEIDGEWCLEGMTSSLEMSILHYEGIGRIGILICKDFISTDHMERMMRSFKLTLILAPSRSTGSYDFKQSFDVCAHDDCNVVWINTCSALASGKEGNFKCIGYTRQRVGRDADQSLMLRPMKTCEGAFRGECKGDCLFFSTIKGV